MCNAGGGLGLFLHRSERVRGPRRPRRSGLWEYGGLPLEPPSQAAVLPQTSNKNKGIRATLTACHLKRSWPNPETASAPSSKASRAPWLEEKAGEQQVRAHTRARTPPARQHARHPPPSPHDGEGRRRSRVRPRRRLRSPSVRTLPGLESGYTHVTGSNELGWLLFLNAKAERL